MNEQERREFLEKFAADLHTEEEHQRFVYWVSIASEEEIAEAMNVYQAIAGESTLKFFPDPALIRKIEAGLDAVEKREGSTEPISRKIYWRLPAVAALVLILIASGLYFYPRSNGNPDTLVKKSPVRNDAVPGGNIALLTLADGSQIVLDQAENGDIANQGGIKVTKTADGQLVYEVAAPASANDKNYVNTISTPRGGQYQINLPDGSRVWLNAASSLTYPVTFTGTERHVELEGEAYFEITHDRARPFLVKSKQQVVEVLGTVFNINSYANELDVRTTLVKGSVRVTRTGSQTSTLLKPGQESRITHEGSVSLVDADIQQATSWKNGNFVFNDMHLVNIMRQLERWYDVDVDYSGLPDTRYNGTISRNVNLSKVLNMLEVTGGLRFRIDGRTVKISR